MTAASTDGLRNRLLRLLLLSYAGLYLLNLFLKLPALKYVTALLLVLVVGQSIFQLPKINRRVVSALFIAGIALLLWKGVEPRLWLEAFLMNANLAALFICVPMMSMPFFYEDYQTQLKNIAQTRMQTLLPFCALVSLSTHILAVLISVGAIAIIYDLMSPNAKLYKSEDTFLATLTRSYCSSGFWSPAWVSMLVLTAQTEISWVPMIPIGITLALLYNGVNLASIAIKTKRHPEAFPRLTPDSEVEVDWGKVRKMGLLALSLIASIILISTFTGLRLLAIVPMVAIAFPIIVALLQNHVPSYKKGIQKYYNISLLKVKNEVTLFVAAGFLGRVLEYTGIGEMIPGLLPTWLNSFPALMSMSLIMLMIIPSMIGVHPVVTGTALVTAIAPAAIGMDLTTFALTMLTGWLLTTLVSPFSAISMITAGLSGHTSWDLGLRINGLFGLTIMVLFSFINTLIGPVLHTFLF